MNTCSTEPNGLITLVREYLKTKHEVDYLAKLYYKVDEDYHELKWSLNNQDDPLIMAGQFDSEEDFLKYVKKEIDTRKMFLVKRFMTKNYTYDISGI